MLPWALPGVLLNPQLLTDPAPEEKGRDEVRRHTPRQRGRPQSCLPPSPSLTLSPENQAGGSEGRGGGEQVEGGQAEGGQAEESGWNLHNSVPTGLAAPRLLNNAVLNSIKAIICCAK